MAHYPNHLKLISWTDDKGVTFQVRDYHGFKIVNFWSTIGDDEGTYVETGYETRNAAGVLVKETWDFNSDEDAAHYIDTLLGELDGNADYSSREDMEREWVAR